MSPEIGPEFTTVILFTIYFKLKWSDILEINQKSNIQNACNIQFYNACEFVKIKWIDVELVFVLVEGSLYQQ